MNRRKIHKHNKKMLHKAIMFSILFLIFFTYCGSLLIYRSYIPENKLQKITGIIENVETKKGFGKYGRSFGILLSLKNTKKTYGIYGGTKTQAFEKENKMNLNIGEKYTFLIDDSVMDSFDNINLGIRKIKNGEKTVFRENLKAHFWFGMAFIILGILSSFIFYYFGKRKFGK
jgi:Trk-type K+ transport system membrane component